MNIESGDNTVTNETENSKNLLKLQQLSELGLEFFDTELDNDALSLNLLNQDSVSLINAPSTSKEQIQVDFSSLNDYVSDSIMVSLSPEQPEILPVSDNILLESDDVPAKNCAFGTDISSKVVQFPENYEIPGIENEKRNVKKLFSNFSSGVSEDGERIRSLKIPNIKVHILPKQESNGFFVQDGETTEDMIKNDVFMKEFVDTSDLDNKINDSLLDLLQDKIIGKNMKAGNTFRGLNKPTEPTNEKEGLKFITIFPSKSVNKNINLMVKGKTCRSKQPLTDLELRIVTRILNQENVLQSKEHAYRNVFYDAESDTNIRYEVRHEGSSEENASSNNNFFKTKKGKPKNGHPEENGQDVTRNDEKYVLKSVARTRCGRVSRPPRHVIRDYKRLKHLTTHNSDVEDENENNGGYADYQVDDPNKQILVEENKKKSEDLYAPLEPNKRQFSALSLCPTCGKVYLGYRRMAIHFQKYPDHKNEELLKKLSEAKKKSFDESVLSDSSEVYTNEDLLVSGNTSTKSNGSMKKKRKLCRKIKTPTKSSTVALKELLSTCDVDELVKYAAPVLANFLSSWEYLLIRSKKLKTNDETFVASLLKEISVVLKQIRNLSQCLLKPCVENKENISNKFIVEEEDILRHVLGIPSGTYTTLNNGNWTKEFFRFTECFKDDQESIDNNVSINSPSPENENIDTTHEHDSVDGLNAQSFYKIDNRIGFSTLDFTRNNIEEQLVLNSSSLGAIEEMNSNTSLPNTVYNKTNNCNEKAMNLFRNLTNNCNESTESTDSNDQEKKFISDSNSNDFSDYNGANSLNFDSFVNSSVDMMNDFPISLPLLSDNSSDSKDCLHLLRTSSAEDLLNSLKNIDNSRTSVMVGLDDNISTELPLTNNATLGSTFTESGNPSTSPCIIDFESISSNFHCND